MKLKDNVAFNHGRALVILNSLSFIVSIFFVIVSSQHAIDMGLKHGLTYEVKTIIDDVETISIQHSFLNIVMASLFGLLFCTTLMSFIWIRTLIGVANEKNKF